MLRKTDNQLGVSPIVGVILMVVLAILLAGLISQFSLELSNILTQPITAGVNIQESYDVNSDTYDVRIVWSSDGTVGSIYAMKPDGTQSPTMTKVGENILIKNLEQGDRINIMGSRSNGDIGVIQGYTVGN